MAEKQKESYGKLYHLNNNIHTDWKFQSKLIERISNLYITCIHDYSKSELIHQLNSKGVPSDKIEAASQKAKPKEELIKLIQNDETPNGFYISYTYDHHTCVKLGVNIANFLINAYIIRIQSVYKDDGESFTYLSPVNLVLDTLDKDFISLINKECIASIKSILNHPHFSECKNQKHISDACFSVKEFNQRFKK